MIMESRGIHRLHVYVMKEINIIPSEIVDKLTFECKVLTVIYMPVHTCMWKL